MDNCGKEETVLQNVGKGSPLIPVGEVSHSYAELWVQDLGPRPTFTKRHDSKCVGKVSMSTFQNYEYLGLKRPWRFTNRCVRLTTESSGSFRKLLEGSSILTTKFAIN